MENEINIVIGGDLFPTPINYEQFSEGAADKIFGDRICDIFKNSDFSICNLEGCFTDDPSTIKLKDGPNIRAPKSCIRAIKDLGVDCLGMANNHVTDYGLKGFEETVKLLEDNGFIYFGAGKDKSHIDNHYIKEVKGKIIVFYAVSEQIENVPTDHTPGVNIYDEYRVCNEIKELKRACDFLIVLYHGGIENFRYITDTVSTRFHRMADCGADIVISQHTHTIGQEEFYKNSYLLYGQGNFCFHFTKQPHEWNSQALLLSVSIKNESFSVQKYLVNRKDPIIEFDATQDLRSFYDRSNRLKNNEDYTEEFKAFVDERMLPYLHAFRGKNVGDKIMRKLLPKNMYIKYLRNRFSTKHILKILLALQCEEFREMSIQGMLNMLEENQR